MLWRIMLTLATLAAWLWAAAAGYLPDGEGGWAIVNGALCGLLSGFSLVAWVSYALL